MSQDAEHDQGDGELDPAAGRPDPDRWPADDDEDPSPGRGRRHVPGALHAAAAVQRRPAPVPVEQHLWRHSFESSALAFTCTLLTGSLLPHAWPLWTVAGAGVTLTAVMGFTSYNATGSPVMAWYLAAWGALLTGWLSAIRALGTSPWHAPEFAGLLIPVLILAPLGALAIGHHREQIRRDAIRHENLADTAPLRRWEKTLARHGVPGTTILDVIEHAGTGVLEIHGRLGKATDKARAITREALDAAAVPITVSKRYDEDAIHFTRPKNGSAADFVMHVRTRSGPRPNVFLPKDNSPTTINRPFPIGVMDNGKPFTMTYREVAVLVIGVRGSGKALDVNTPIATPAGWTTMGELQPGDQVFGQAGQPCRVMAATEVMHGRPCYEMVFSDGTVITADAGHQWQVDIDGAGAQVVTTEKLIPALRPDGHGGSNCVIRAPGSLWHVTEIRPVPSRPVRCIMVDSPDSLYLAGDSCVPTHNSNLQSIFIAQLARCIDAVVFMIDLKGGRSARPWMMPWVQGHTPRPVIDWLATTREEALTMLEALLRGGQARAASGRGWDKITPSADVPAIILVVDETAVMTGHGIRADGISNYTIAQLLAQFVETYRSEAMDLLCAALRGNVDIMGSTAVKAMTEVRIGLRVTAASEGDSIFPDNHQAAKALSRLHNSGDGLVMTGADISPAVHFYRIGGEAQIHDVALSTGAIRPAPEDALAAAMGEAYEQRWTRPHGQDLLAKWRESAGIPEPPERDEKDPFWEIVGHQEDPERPLDPRRVKIREYLYQRGPQGYTTQRLLGLLKSDGLNGIREVVQRWLADDESKGLVRRTGSPLHRWVWHAGQGPDDAPGAD
jgi:hypothetical protein